MKKLLVGLIALPVVGVLMALGAILLVASSPILCVLFCAYDLGDKILG